MKKCPLFFRFKKGFEDLEFNSNWKSVPLCPIKCPFFCEITQKSSFNGQYSWRCRIISGNWNPLKNHEKYFLFHLNKLNILLANQILHISWIIIKPNVWYLWSLKRLAIKRWFPFNFAKIWQSCYFVVGGTKNFKLLADISFDSSLQNAVLPSLLLFLCACY